MISFVLSTRKSPNLLACIDHKSVEICDRCRLHDFCGLVSLSHWGSQLRLSRRADVAVPVGVAFQEKNGGSCFNAVRRNSDDRNFKIVVGEYEVIPERPI